MMEVFIRLSGHVIYFWVTCSIYCRRWQTLRKLSEENSERIFSRRLARGERLPPTALLQPLRKSNCITSKGTEELLNVVCAVAVSTVQSSINVIVLLSVKCCLKFSELNKVEGLISEGPNLQARAHKNGQLE